jgi:hypothetical protein
LSKKQLSNETQKDEIMRVKMNVKFSAKTKKKGVQNLKQRDEIVK